MYRKKRIPIISIIILLIGLSIGSYMIYNGLSKTNQKKLNKEIEILNKTKQDLINLGIKYDENANFSENEKYNLMLITNVLKNDYYCELDEYNINNLTKNYCIFKKNGLTKNNNSTIIGIIINIVTIILSILTIIIIKNQKIKNYEIYEIK